ncbi:MAG TPA: hypothetical protein VKV03_09465 [Candidatus Binataceae bacterium]|jgi:hypothetical protein|nr:hypothetical protein [Candidatus Binataceae bacterium]
MPSFPEPAWFLALGRLMEAEGALFQRLGYAETRFVVRVIPDETTNGGETLVGVVIDGYRMIDAAPVGDLDAFDADFVICAKRSVWDRMLREIAESGRPSLRHTLSSLALVGEEMWLESTDQLREDKFYRFNQTLQELLNLASHLPAPTR